MPGWGRLDSGQQHRLDAGRVFRVPFANSRENPRKVILELTDGLGADVSIEAAAVLATFELATTLPRPGGHIANIGVHCEPGNASSGRPLD